MKTNNETAKSSPKSFSQTWNSIDATGTDEQKSDKQKLLELAEAGKLTREALENTSLASVFEEAGVSIEEATEKINKMKSSAGQLASMKTGISSISGILGEKEENLSSKETRTKGIDPDTLAGMPEDVRAQTEEYEHFAAVLGDGSSKMKDCQDAADKLATAYINSNGFLENLDEDTEGYYTTVLKQMGAQNAAQVVTEALAQKTALLTAEKEYAKKTGRELSDATSEEILAFAAEAQCSEETKNALFQMALQKELAGRDPLKTSGSVANLIRLAEQCGITGKAIKELQTLKNLMDERKAVEENTSMNASEQSARLANLDAKILAQTSKAEKTVGKKANETRKLLRRKNRLTSLRSKTVFCA